MPPTRPRNILLIKPSALGDVALALPALCSLRASFPDAKITWLVRPEFADLLKRVKALDEILPFDRRFLGRWWCRPKPAAALWGLLRTLRQRRFDLVIDLQGLFRTAFFAWVTGCRRRYGLSTAREMATLFYTHRVGPHPNSVHVIDEYLRIVEATGADALRAEYGLAATADDRKAAGHLLAEAGLQNQPYAVLVTGSAHALKCWPIEHFAQLAERLSGRFGTAIVAVGTQGEKAAVDRLADLAQVPVVNLAGRTGLGALVGVLAGAHLVVSNDTGPGHIAVALDRPTVLIVGPTNPARICPYKHRDAVAAVNPFGRGRTINDYNPLYRINRVSVEMVLDAIQHRLGGPPQDPNAPLGEP